MAAQSIPPVSPVDAGGAGRGRDMDLPAMLYADLKRIAHRQLMRRVPGATLSTTMLVHETWARLAERGGNPPQAPAHFLALCARVMRQVVVDHARSAGATKRGGECTRVVLDEVHGGSDHPFHALLQLADAIDALEQADPRLVRLIEQHWFIGVEADELAVLHGVSLRTVQRELKRARAWVTDLLAP